MTQDEQLRVPARTSRLQANASEFDEDGGPWTISGLAVGAGDILHMDDGTPVLFTEENLRIAASSQQGERLTVDHPSDEDGTPIYPPPVDDTVGTVDLADYVVDGTDNVEGVGYEATTHDPDIARGVQAESYEVSVHPVFNTNEVDEETGALIAEDIRFLDLSMVSHGDSLSNSARWGPSRELAAWANGHDVGELLAESSSVDDPTDNPEGEQESTASLFHRLGQRMGFFEATATESNNVGSSDEQPDDESAESDADADADNQSRDSSMEDDTPEDDEVEQTPDEGETTEDNVVEIDIGDHEDFDSYLSERISGEVAASREATEKGEMVDEVIAGSDRFDEEDEEELMASPMSVIEAQYEQVTATTAAPLPGTTGRRELSAGAFGDEDDLDAYGTGVGGD